MRRSKQGIFVTFSQLIIELFFLFNIAACAKLHILPDVHGETNEDRPLETILSNYHSDAEQLQKSATINHFENKSNEGEKAKSQANKIKYEQQLKIVKRSPATYNFEPESKRGRQYSFGLGKRNNEMSVGTTSNTVDEKQAQILENKIRKFLNYLYNLDINLIWNYLSNMNEEDVEPSLTTNKITNELLDEESDDPQSEKYKAKRDTLKRQRQFNFGIGKRERQYAFGIGKRFSTNYGMGNPRLEEYIKRRYSFGIGKRSVD